LASNHAFKLAISAAGATAVGATKVHFSEVVDLLQADNNKVIAIKSENDFCIDFLINEYLIC
jgi:hypothetical protein